MNTNTTRSGKNSIWVSRMSSLSPTQRTLKGLRDKGFTADVVEKWIRNPKHPAGGFRRDYLHIIDILALTPDGVMGVQSCGSDFAAHWRTLTEEQAENTRKWLSTPGTSLELWGWRKIKAVLKSGKKGKAMRWQPRIKVITLADLKEEG